MWRIICNAIHLRWFFFLVMVEETFSLYRITLRKTMTTYYCDVERKGRLTGMYQHQVNLKWEDGRYPHVPKKVKTKKKE